MIITVLCSPKTPAVRAKMVEYITIKSSMSLTMYSRPWIQDEIDLYGASEKSHLIQEY